MISVIITTYKREPLMISRAIESVLCQTYKDIEIIVVDDSPADYVLRCDVKNVILSYNHVDEVIPVYYIEHDKNKGACAARNTGLNYTHGDFIAFLDDDDEWLPEKLEKQIKTMLDSDAGLVYCGRICKNDTTGVSSIENVKYCNGNVFNELLYYNFIGSTSFPLIKSQCIKEIGGFDEQMQSAQDYDVWLRIAKQYTIDYVPEPLVIYHEHGGEQITNNPQKKIQGLKRLNEKYKDYLNVNRQLWYRRNICIAPFYSMAGQRRTALAVWSTCVCKCPGKLLTNIRYLRLIYKGIKREKWIKKEQIASRRV